MSNITISDRMQPISGSAIREIFKYLGDPELISLAGGNPSPKSFDEDMVAKLSAQALFENGKVILQYGSTEGYAPFLEVAQELQRRRGIRAKRENLLALTGSSQGIELAAKALLNKGDVILVEDPTFLGALQTFRTYEARPVGVSMDNGGIIIDDLKEKLAKYSPKAIYIIPNFQNPSGRTMTLERREQTLELCREAGCLIIEDDPYGELRYNGRTIRNMKAMDDDGGVLLLSTFSKTVSPGLRVGYANGDPELIRKMTIAKQGMDTCTSNLSQAIVEKYVTTGEYTRHVAEIINFYRTQRDAMASAIKKYMPPCKYALPDGGLFFWMELEGINATALFHTAIEHKVAYVPGTHFYADGGHDDTLRFNFSMPTVSQIEKGVQIMGELLRQ